MRFGTFEQAAVAGFLILIAGFGAYRIARSWWRRPEDWGVWP